MIFVRSLLLLATTLAAGRAPSPSLNQQHSNSSHSNSTQNDESCAANSDSLELACRGTDPLILPEHIILPLLLPCAALLFTHMPTLLLASRARVRDLKGATVQALLSGAGASGPKPAVAGAGGGTRPGASGAGKRAAGQTDLRAAFGLGSKPARRT